MIGILESLRIPVQWGYLGDHGRFIEDNAPIKAAEEIERLQMELRAEKQDHGAVVAGLQGEIERLQASNRELTALLAQERAANEK